MPTSPRKAVFLDRDNTLIADPGYINNPDMVQLLPGAAESIRRLNAAGYAVIVATNQSGVARGLITEEQLGEVHERLRELLLEQGAKLDGIYCCPYLDGPEAVVEEYRQASPLRKPQPGMLLQAADELSLDLASSWMIGDSARDVEAGAAAGCRTIRIGSSDGAEFGAKSLAEAVAVVLRDPPRAPVAPLAQTVPPEQPQPATTAPVARANDAEIVGVLGEMRDILRRRERAAQHEDFSVARLIGTLGQMLALVVAGWGVAALLNHPESAAPRFLLAVFLQLATLTAFVGARR